MKSVFVPLDGSRFAEAALPAAFRLAKATGARIRLALVHAASSGIGLGSEGVTAETTALDDEVRYLEAVAGRLDPGDDDQVELLRLDGRPGPSLTQAITSGGDDVVVMATHGRGAFSRFWLGSVTDYLVRHVDVPVLLIRPEGEEPVYREIRFGHVLVPLDGSRAAEAILPPLVTLIRALATDEVRVSLLAVVEPAVLAVGEVGLPYAVPADPRVLEEHRQTAERRLAQVSEQVSGSLAGATVQARVTVGQPALAILEFARDQAVDLIAMTTHGEGGLRRLLIGSVADKVIRAGALPVFVLRPPAER